MERVIDEISEVIAACFRRYLKGHMTEARQSFLDHMRELQNDPAFSSGYSSSEHNRAVPRGAILLDDIEDFAEFIGTTDFFLRITWFGGPILSFEASEADLVIRKLETLVDILEGIRGEALPPTGRQEGDDELPPAIADEDLDVEDLRRPRGNEEEDEGSGRKR